MRRIIYAWLEPALGEASVSQNAWDSFPTSYLKNSDVGDASSTQLLWANLYYSPSEERERGRGGDESIK